MRVVRAHDGRSILVNQPLSHFPTLDDLLDCFSLATEIPSDAIICMTADGSQLKQELLDRIIHNAASSTSASDSSTTNTAAVTAAKPQSATPPDPTAESHAHEFFVYNRDFLYTDPTELAAELAEHAVLNVVPPMPDAELAFPPTPKALEAIVAWTAEIGTLAAEHEHTCRDLLNRITLIARSLQVALANLRDHADDIEKGAKALIDDVAQKELTRMQNLLQGYERDLRILGMVSIHPRLQSSGAQMATTTTATGSSTTQNGTSNGSSAVSKPKHRTLGDYISKSKMSAVADACQRVFSELRERIERIDMDLTLIRNDTQGLSEEVEATTPQVADETYQRVAEALARTRELDAFIESTCSPDAQGWPVADKLDRATFERVVRSCHELLLLNEVAREAVQRLTQDRNDILERSLHLLIDISGIQSEFTETSSLLAAVDADLHSNKLDGFKHLHRLKNMLWAYGATVVEVVRRREFAKHFLGKSQSLAELMAKLSASEWKRRQFYRSDVSSLLPWEVKGMDDKPPSLEITTPRVSSEGTADLSLADLDALYELLDQVDQRLRQDAEGGGPAAASPIPEVKAALQSLAAALQDLDDEFIHLVNIQLLNKDDDEEGSDEDGDESGSDTSIRARRRERRRLRLTASLAAANDQELAQLRRELHSTRAAKEEAERALKADGESRALGLKAEVETLRRQLETSRSEALSLETERRDAQNRIETLLGDLEVERERRLNMVDEVNQLRRDLEQSHRAEAAAKQEAMEDAERVAELEAQAHELHVELDEAKSARIDASNRIEALLSEGSSAEGELRTAQARIDELTEHLSSAHADAARAREAAAEVEAAKERQIRSYRAEADGDRAILEERVRALKAELEAKQQLLQQQTDVAQRAEQSRVPDREAIELLRGQLQAADVAHEEIVKEMDRAKELADEAEAARREVEASRQLLLERARTLLAKTSQLRKTVRAMPVHSSSRQASASSPGPALGAAVAQRAIAASTGSLSASELSESQRQAALDAFDAEAEGARLETTIEALRAFDAAEMYAEVKAKLDALNVLVRKWQKAWKSANDKVARATAAARDKIAFRNFRSGDLALFLPTRNSNLAPKPWAAFNISAPHFFLNAQQPLAEQLRTKEWIVARITTITDCVVPAADAGEAEKDAEDANPFRLAPGVRYFLLDVETYSGHSSAPPIKSRKSSSAAIESGSSGRRGAEKEVPPAHPRSQSEGALTGVQKISEAQTGTSDVQDALAPAADSGGAVVEEPHTRGEEDGAGQTSGFSLRSDKLAASEAATPPMATPATSPPTARGALPDAMPGAMAGAVAASGLTRAMRSISPASSLKADGSLGAAGAHGRWRASSSASTNAHWTARGIRGIAEEGSAQEGEASTTSSHRSALIEHATLAPAFGRKQGGRVRALSPSAPSHDGEGEGGGSGVTSAPASQTRSEGIAIRTARPRREMVDTAVSNPFSQSPGPASLPASRDAMGTLGRGAPRKSSLNISSGPRVQRWPSTGSSTTASAAGSAAGGGVGIRINGRSIVVEGGGHRRSSSQGVSGAQGMVSTAVTTTHAVPGAFPSSYSSSGSIHSIAEGEERRARGFLSQTLGRLTGAAVQTVGPPFASIEATRTAEQSPARSRQKRPSLFAAVAGMDDEPEASSAFSNTSTSSAEGLLKRLGANPPR